MSPAAAQTARQETPRESILVLGKISQDPRKHFRYLEPMVDYAASQLADVGIREGRVLMAKDWQQMVGYLKDGSVDWVTETMFVAAILQEHAGGKLLARKAKKGAVEYHSIFIARRESEIQSLEDLAGKTVAFEDPGSTTAFFLPAVALLERGLKLRQLTDPTVAPAPDEVGFVFAGAEINISAWVHRGIVDAGAYSNLDWEKPDHNPLPQRAGLQIFHRTDPVPRAFELVRGDLAPPVRERLRQLLLEAHDDPSAQHALREYQETTRFDPIDDPTRAHLSKTRVLLDRVQSALE